MNIEKTDYDVRYKLNSCMKTGILIGMFLDKITSFEAQTKRQLNIESGSIFLQKATREELLIFIKIFGGKWNKTVEDYYPDKIRYSQTIPNPLPNRKFDSMLIFVSEAEPPASCQIVEVDEPYPAGVRKTKKIICKQAEDEVPVEKDTVTEKVEPTEPVEELASQGQENEVPF